MTNVVLSKNNSLAFLMAKTTNISLNVFCANEHELVASSVMIRDAYKSLTGGKDMWEGRLELSDGREM